MDYWAITNSAKTSGRVSEIMPPSMQDLLWRSTKDTLYPSEKGLVFGSALMVALFPTLPRFSMCPNGRCFQQLILYSVSKLF